MSERQSQDIFAAVTSAASAALSLESRDEGRYSPHAAQLTAGFRWLMFAPALEKQFREFYQQRHLIRTRIALFGGAILFAMFSLRDIRILPEYVWNVTLGLRLGVMVPATLLVLGATFVPRLSRAFEWIAAAGVVTAMGALACAILVAEVLGHPLPYEGLMVVMVFSIFLSGLRFYKAMLSTVLTASGYLIARAIIDPPGGETLQQAYYILVIMLIGLVGSYSLELSLRTNFLVEHIALFRATRDTLTHLHNRRAALDHLQRAWRLAFRERKTIAIVLIDVDHFKAYNDQHGHGQGDACLADVAVVLRDRFPRPMDIAARYGGEEFIAVLYDVDEKAATRICEDVRRAVAELRIPHAENAPYGVVTISLGVALAQPAAGTATVATTIETADAALYRAKAGGRNRCEMDAPRQTATSVEIRDFPRIAATPAGPAITR